MIIYCSIIRSRKMPFYFQQFILDIAFNNVLHKLTNAVHVGNSYDVDRPLHRRVEHVQGDKVRTEIIIAAIV